MHNSNSVPGTSFHCSGNGWVTQELSLQKSYVSYFRTDLGKVTYPATSPENSLLQESHKFPVHDLLLDRAPFPEQFPFSCPINGQVACTATLHVHEI